MAARRVFGSIIATAVGVLSTGAMADEGGISFWLPGSQGSLAAVPGEAGLSWATIYYHTSVDAGGGAEFAHGGDIRLGIDGRGNIALFGPTYTFEEPVLGGQLSLSALVGFGQTRGSVDAVLTGPGGGVLSGSATDKVTDFTDVFPQATLKWNDGVHNYMTYVLTNIPVGAYDEDRLANMGLGHWAIDGGVGYTFLNPATGIEFSAIAGLTYNAENEHTDYQNGIDGHIDLAASVFLAPTVHVGVAGYYFQQLTGDSGEGAVLGDFKSRVAAIGPQAGFFFPAGHMKGYFNIKGFYEFAAENRPEGWNLWATLAFTPGGHSEQ